MSKLLVTIAYCCVFTQLNAQYVAEILPPGIGGHADGAGGGQIIGKTFGPSGGPTLWDGPQHKFIDLSTSGYTQVTLQGVGGGQQVGYGVSGSAHALAWLGSPSSVIDLHPAGYTGSQAIATDGVHQVGSAGVGGNLNHAVLWKGSAFSVVDLHPQGFRSSSAYGVSGDVQVGAVLGDGDGSLGGAVAWRGSSATMEFLPAPQGFVGEAALAVHGNQAVGRILNLEAVVWDLQDWTYELLGDGYAVDTNGSHQVGYRGAFENARAVRWSGTEASALDLHQFVPAKVTDSHALGIDENGIIVGMGTVVGVGTVPLVWTPVPEPSTFLALGTCTTLLILSRRRKR